MAPPFKAKNLGPPTYFPGDYANVRLEFENGDGDTCCVDLPLELASRLLPLLSERVERHRRMEQHLNPDADMASARMRHLLGSLSVASYTLHPQDRRFELEASAHYGATIRLIFDREHLESLCAEITRTLDESDGGPSHSGTDMTH